jgi:hypothetical protein
VLLKSLEQVLVQRTKVRNPLSLYHGVPGLLRMLLGTHSGGGGGSRAGLRAVREAGFEIMRNECQLPTRAAQPLQRAPAKIQ